MNEEELNFKTDLIIPEKFYKECLSADYNINDMNKIKEYLDDSDSLIKLKGLVGLRKILKIEEAKEEPALIYNDINKLFNLLENYPTEFKSECLTCLSCIEEYNIKVENKIKNEPTDKIINIILYILEYPKKFNLELIHANLKYISLLVNNNEITKKLGIEKLYKTIKNLIENVYPSDITKISICLTILSKIIENNKKTPENENIYIESIPLSNEMLNKFESNKDIAITSLHILYFITNDVDKMPLLSKKILDTILEIHLLDKIISKIDKLDVEDEKLEILYSSRIIGNFAAMEDSFYTDKVIELNVLDKLKILIQDKYSPSTRKEIAWIISNVAAGTQEQLNTLYENNFPDILFDMILNGEEGDIKNHCLWALYNFSNLNNQEYLNSLVESGFLDIIIKRLNIDSGDTLCCSMEALFNILSKRKNVDPANFNIIESKIEELNILNELKNFLNNNNHMKKICRDKAKTILNKCFAIENVDQFLKESQAEIK